MKHEMLIVKVNGKYHGPFREDEARVFASRHQGDVAIIHLWLPSVPGEASGPETLKVLEAEGYRAYIDSSKADTHLMLAAITQDFYFACRQRRMLTAQELDVVWENLYDVSRSVESLMTTPNWSSNIRDLKAWKDCVKRFGGIATQMM